MLKSLYKTLSATCSCPFGRPARSRLELLHPQRFVFDSETRLFLENAGAAGKLPDADWRVHAGSGLDFVTMTNSMLILKL